MAEQAAASVPTSIGPLLEGTPGANHKLLAAWDGLSVETQIAILTTFRERERVISTELARQALGSRNTYVRYLAAVTVEDAALKHGRKQSSPDGAGFSVGLIERLADRIQADSDPLVRYALRERESLRHDELSDEQIDAYLREPIEARLAVLRSLNDGAQFARILRHALACGFVPERELVVMAEEYVGQPGNLNFAEIDARDVGVACGIMKDFEALWRLVPDMPRAVGIALVAKLPAQTESWDQIPEEVLNRMDQHVLTRLLYRKDVGLHDRRKNIAFRRKVEKHGDLLIGAATHRCFDLTDEEFERLCQAEPERLAEMDSACDMRLVVTKAAAEFFGARESLRDGSTADEFEALYEWRLRTLKGARRRRELRHLRLYLLAKRLADRESSNGRPVLGESEKWLREHVVSGNPWATYRRLTAAWERRRGWNERERQRWKVVVPSLSDQMPDGVPRRSDKERIAQKLRSIDRRLAVVEKQLRNAGSFGHRAIRTAMWVVGLWVTLSVLGRVFG